MAEPRTGRREEISPDDGTAIAAIAVFVAGPKGWSQGSLNQPFGLGEVRWCGLVSIW